MNCQYVKIVVNKIAKNKIAEIFINDSRELENVLRAKLESSFSA